MTQQPGSAAHYTEPQTAAFLAAVLYRADCPTAEMLLDYQLELLAPAQRRTLQQHLTICPHCIAEVDELTQIDARPEEEVDAVPRRMRLLDQLRSLFPGRPLVDALIQPSAAPTLALRGAAADLRAAQQFIYRADVYRLSISISAALSTSNVRQLEGSVIDESEPTYVLAGYVHLIHHEDVVQQVDIDEFGYFSLNNIPPDRYTLLVELPRHSLWIQELSVS